MKKKWYKKTLIRISKFSKEISKFNWEFILINDWSRDNKKKIIKELNNYPLKIVLLIFSRKFGHQPAVQAS